MQRKKTLGNLVCTASKCTAVKVSNVELKKLCNRIEEMVETCLAFDIRREIVDL